MSFQDKSIWCSDCGTTFTFSAEDQEFFLSKGYTNEPKRCMVISQFTAAIATGKSDLVDK